MSWRDKAACKGKDINIFFPVADEDADNPYLDTREKTLEAAKLCRECPVKDPCREEAIQNDEYGVWGGISRVRRVTILEQRMKRSVKSAF